MSKLLILYEFKTPTSVMMGEIFMRISEENLSDVWFIELAKVTPNDIMRADVIIFIRPTDILSVRIAEKAKKAEKYVIAAFDDDLMNRPADRPIISWRRTNVKRVLNASDMVLSSNLRICNKYKSMTIEKRGVKMDTAVYPDEFRTNGKTDSDIIRIVYAANPSHAALFEKYINPAIPLFDKVAKQIKFTFIGVRPRIPKEIIPHNVQVEYVEGMSFFNYRKYMDSHDFDVGLAPLANDEFSKCKYINKFLEYAIFQIPGIFTNSEPYTHIIKDGENGYLTDNTEKDWAECLLKVISDKARYKRCGMNAMQTVRMEFDADHIMQKLFKEIPEMLTYDAPERKCESFFLAKMEYLVLNVSEKIFLTAEYLKRSGIIGLKNKIIGHLKEKKVFEKV